MTAEQYAELVKRHIETCQFLDNHPHFPAPIQIPADNPSYFFYSDIIYLRDNHILRVSDLAMFGSGGMIERNFSYDFRRRDTNRLIWRICNHRRWESVDKPTHVHTNPDNDNELIEFFDDSRRTNFLYLMHCIKNYFEEQPQDWEVL